MKKFILALSLLLSVVGAGAQSADTLSTLMSELEQYGPQPYRGKKILSLGDSYTYQNYYGKYLAKATGCTQRGRGYNGAGLKWFVGDEYQDPATGQIKKEEFNAELLNQYDIITVMGGTNNWGGHYQIGSLDDAPGTETIYGETKLIIEKILTIKPDAKIFFCTQPFRYYNGLYHQGIGCYDKNDAGFTLEQTMDAIRRCAAYYGIPCFDFYHLSGWNEYTNVPMNGPSIIDKFSGNPFTSDGLHPKDGDGMGADILGTAFGKFINRH